MGSDYVAGTNGWAVATRRCRAGVIRILVDNDDDRAAVLAAMERGRLADLLLRPFVMAWDRASLAPDAACKDSASSALDGSGG